MEQAVSDYLRDLRIPISRSYFEKLVQSHPDFPSLLSVSDTLKRLGIEHVATRVRREDLSAFSFPYLLALESGKEGALLIQKASDFVKYQKELRHWGGVVLQVETTNHLNDDENNELFDKERKIRNYTTVLIVILALIFCSPVLYNFNWMPVSLMATAVIGIAVGYFLVAKDLGISYKAIDEFCSVGKHADCDSVLKSGLSVFDFSLSEIVLTYFSFQFFGCRAF